MDGPWCGLPGVLAGHAAGAGGASMGGVGLVATVGAPGGAEPPTGLPPNPFSKYAPTVLIVVGGIVVVSVLMGLSRMKRTPEMPTLEERLGRLGEEKRAEREAGGGLRESGAGLERAGGSPSLRLAGGGGGRESAVGEARRAIEEVAQDAEELAERLAVAMDARAARLEGLLREADEKIRRLEELRRSAAAGGGADRSRVGAAGAEPGWAGEHGGSVGERSAGGPRSSGGRGLVDEGDPVQREVFALADQGMAAVEIARRVNQPTGQVELMLALRGR